MPGKNIKREREQRNWTIEELALRSETSIATISRLENGIRGFTEDTLTKVARALELEVYELFRVDDDEIRSHAIQFDGRVKKCMVEILRLRSNCEESINRILEQLTGGISFRTDREKAIKIIKIWIDQFSNGGRIEEE